MKSEKMGQSLLLIAFLGFAVLLQVEGSCDLKCRSRRRPVCGTDGVTYRNRCELKKAACENPGLSVKHRRKCIVVNEKSCNSRCGSSRKPFCGTDGVTYQNRCELKRAICKDPKLSLKHKGACKDPCEKEICPLIKCAPGFISKIIGSDCCSTCVLDCSKMFCPQVACQEGLESFVPDGSCCPDCRPTLGGCPVPSKRACFKGGPDDVPGCESDSDCKGIQKCCQDVCTKICKYPVPDCRLILCDEPICPEGQETYTADGECCPKCRPINFEDSICFLPEEVGQCKAAIPRWRFNFEKCECEQFTYGGCGGNENNFETEQDCSENCGSNNIVNCLVSPCEFATCPGYKDAECVENYCGGCNALWYVKGERVTCNDCSLVDCPIPACLKGYEIYTPEGECCPQCRPVDNPCDSPPICITLYDPICGSDGNTYGNDCEFSHAKLCEDPSLTKVHQGICKADCRLVRCALPECPEGQTTYIPEGQCCPQCRPGVDCRLVRCALPECPKGQTTYIPEGQCCPQCRSGVDCSLVLCALAECPEGQETYIPEGECCPHCGSDNDCSLVPCAIPVCNKGQETYTPEGECCPQCRSVCNLPLEAGPCEAVIPRWGFGDGECVEFTYGGCEGNNNNFESQEECENVCELGVDCSLVLCALPECPEGQETYIPEGECCPHCRSVCSLPLEAGPCDAAISRWGFGDGECVEFTYGGCEGNNNNFESQEECENICELEVDCSLVDCALPVCNEGQETYTPGGECCPECRSVCNLPLEAGPCEAVIPRWGFGDGECVEFTYGGCEGNNNNFESQEECENVCELGVDCSLVDCPLQECPEGQETYIPEGECCPHCRSVCSLPLEAGPCEAAISRWGFGDGECVEFTYGGCEGNNNNFESQEECENICE